MSDMTKASPKPEPAAQPSLAWRVHGWVLALLRFCGGYVLVYPFVFLGYIVCYPNTFRNTSADGTISELVSLILMPFVTAGIVIYFGWFFHRKTRLPDAVVGLFTGAVYFLGGIAFALALTILFQIRFETGLDIHRYENGFEFAVLFYLLCGLAAVLFAMKGSRLF